MYDENEEEIGESPIDLDDDALLDDIPEDMDFGLDEEDPDRDR